MNCSKNVYRTELDAKIALANISRNDRKNRPSGRRPGQVREETRTYQCPSCRKWHLTSMPKN